MIKKEGLSGKQSPNGAVENMGSLTSLPGGSAESGTVRSQYGALCWQPNADAVGIEVLLITSRDTGRWIIPKGWPMLGLAPEDVAAQEAWEEAGVTGDILAIRAGSYGYFKTFAPATRIPCAVTVFGLQVRHLAETFPEVKERRRQWFPQAVAAGLVDEAELATIIARYAPPPSGRRTVIAGAD